MSGSKQTRNARVRKNSNRIKEIKDYYLRSPVEEISSYTTPLSFDLWDSIETYRSKLGIGKRWIDIGGGVGEIAAISLKKGYDVHVTDVFDELIQATVDRHPELKTRISHLDLFDTKNVNSLLASKGSFDIVTALGAVLNHAANRLEVRKGFGNLVRFGHANSLIIIDVMLREMLPGHPASIWSEFLHVLVGFDDIYALTRLHKLELLETYSIQYIYPSKKGKELETERALRLLYYKRT